MKIKEIIKNIWGFVLAWLISLVFSYFLLNYCNSSGWLAIIIVYLILLAISIIIFYYVCHFQIFVIPFIPVFPIVVFFLCYISCETKKYFKKEKINQNIHANIVVIITHFNWYNIDYYINATTTFDDIKAMAIYLKEKGTPFSFYLQASRNDIEKIMVDKKVREVYFVGHGDSDEFQIDTNNFIKYIEFDNKKYLKDYVYQIHCGSKKGIPLRNYVVPKKNWKNCYFVRKSIVEKDIVKYFKKQMLSLKK